MKSLLVALLIMLQSGLSLADEPRTLPKEITTVNGGVEARGRWVVTARVNSTAPLLARLNSVEVVCYKARGICNEAIAVLYTVQDVPQLSAPFLTAVMSEYKITRWDVSGITAISAKPVADVELKIDLKAGTVTRRHQETKARGSQTANPNAFVTWELK